MGRLTRRPAGLLERAGHHEYEEGGGRREIEAVQPVVESTMRPQHGAPIIEVETPFEGGSVEIACWS